MKINIIGSGIAAALLVTIALGIGLKTSIWLMNSASFSLGRKPENTMRSATPAAPASAPVPGPTWVYSGTAIVAPLRLSVERRTPERLPRRSPRCTPAT